MAEQLVAREWPRERGSLSLLSCRVTVKGRCQLYCTALLKGALMLIELHQAAACVAWAAQAVALLGFVQPRRRSLVAKVVACSAEAAPSFSSVQAYNESAQLKLHLRQQLVVKKKGKLKKNRYKKIGGKIKCQFGSKSRRAVLLAAALDAST